jgi:Putative peptidoglycan binding domain
VNILRQGSRGFQVEFLQRLLNKAATRDRTGGTLLSVDGTFGPRTEAALRAFQGRHTLRVVDGTAGNQSWNALRLRTEREHARVIRFGQPTGTSCWSAAATMILGNRSVGPGSATLASTGALRATLSNKEAFARSLG